MYFKPVYKSASTEQTGKSSYKFYHPVTDEEKEEYKVADKITTLDANQIRDAILTKKVKIFNVPDVVHSSIPPETVSDDILKRLLKRAFIAKGIDIDQCKSRFVSKNMLFNFKSVMRNTDTKLSMLLFDRGVEALNLKYVIILDEAGGGQIGRSLQEPLVISSDDVFDETTLNATQNEDEEDDEDDFD